MRFAKFGTFAVVALSLMSVSAHASPINRKFHPVVNDDPQNAHLNVQTPGADSNQNLTIKEEPGADGQVIPVGDTKVASCVAKDANGDIDLSGGGSCASSSASAAIAQHATVTAATSVPAASPAPQAASQTVRVPSHTSPSFARTGNANAPRSAPASSVRAAEAAPAATPVPAHHTAIARAIASSLPGKQLAAVARADITFAEFARAWWLEIGAAAALLFALGLGLMFRMGLADLLRMRRGDERSTDEEAQSAVPDVVQDPLLSP